jgi:hypothetical protein
MVFWGRTHFQLAAALLCGFLLIAASCNDKSTNNNGEFDVYGRIIYRPPIAGPSLADFSLFHKGNGITDAIITVKAETLIAVQSESGRYRLPLNLRIGDTLAYTISSAYGSADGNVVIPDTVEIIRPRAMDTLLTGTGFTGIWHRGSPEIGYFAYLQNQGGYVASLHETQIDTLIDFLGENILNFGADTFWVETLRGGFTSNIAPTGKLLPRGVVGAAGNFRAVYVSYAR